MFYYIIVIIIILVFILDRCKSRNLMRLYRDIGNELIYLPVVGHAYMGLKSNEETIKLATNNSIRCANNSKYGMLAFWLVNKLMIGVGDAPQTMFILKTVHDKSFIARLMSHLTGNGSIFSTGAISHRRRKILVPTFASRHINKFIRIFQTNAEEVVERFESKLGKGNFSCWNKISLYALDSVCESIFGVKVDALKQPNHPFVLAFQEYLKNIASRVVHPWLLYDILYKLLPVYTRQNQAKIVMHDFVNNIIKRRRMSETGNTDKFENVFINYTPFLELIYTSSVESGKRYTPVELREESLVLLLAGTDTSATALSFTLLLLSLHQDVQEKVFQELQKVFGDINRPIENQDLLKLEYMDAVIKESLRLYPPVPFLTRDTMTDTILPRGLTIPTGCTIILSIIGIHRNPIYWGDDVEAFKPERFLSNNTATSNYYMPFGYGPRKCPGYVYAMLSIKTTLVTILRRYRLLPASSFKYDADNPLRVVWAIMLKHVHNYEIRIQRRDKASAFKNPN